MANVDRNKEIKHTNKSIKQKYTENLKISYQISYIFLSPLENSTLNYSWNEFWYVSYCMYHIYLWLYSSIR